MTQRARRIYYSLAFVVFLIVAPIILAIAQGYQWAGWRHGFVPTGVVAISVSARSTITINGEVAKKTTRVLKRLRPGQYEVSVARQGYGTWEKLIRVQARVADVIGPVVLLPETLRYGNQGPTSTKLLSDAASGIVVGANQTATGWDLAQRWPTGTTWTLAIADEPTAIRFSPKNRLLVISTATNTIVATLGSTSAPWVTGQFNNLLWSDQGDFIFYAFQLGHLMTVDVTARTLSLVADRTSAGWFNHQLWSTEVLGGQTKIYRQSSDTGALTVVNDLNGRWLIESAPDGLLFVRNQTDHQAIAYAGSDTLNPLSLGPVDTWWWPRKSEAPLWQAGAQLMTLDTHEQPTLLERGPQTYQAVYWLVPQHILATFDGTTVTVRSVSDRQGRGILLQQKTVPAELLAVDRGRKLMIFRTTGEPSSSLFTLSWQ